MILFWTVNNVLVRSITFQNGINCYVIFGYKTRNFWNIPLILPFWTQDLPEGVLSNALVRPSVRTALRIFLIFCMKLGHYKGTKVTEPDFWKKNLGGSQMGENPHFWGIFDVFCPYLKNGSKDFDEILRLNSPHWYLTLRENRMS